jgi:hypothetical protein
MVPMLKQLSGNTILILEMRELRICDDGTVNVGQIINEEHKPEEVFSELWFLQGDGYCWT